MISFAVENFNNNKLIKKTPRYKLKTALMKSVIFNNMLKFISYRALNTSHSDKFYNYFIFTRFINKSTVALNLSLSYYYNNLKILNGCSNELNKKVAYSLNNSIRLLGLPVSFKVNNFVFFFSTYFNLSYYSPFYKFYSLKSHYFHNQKLLSTYYNLNYYYSKIYEH